MTENKILKMGTRIIEMNKDCIEHVLKLLNFKDLLSVAESNEILSSVVSRVISHRFHRYRLTLTFCGSEFRWQHHHHDYRIDDGEIRALKFRTGVKILRHFGHLCSQITIGYKYMSLKEKRTIEYYLSKYCSDESVSITDLIMEDCPEDALLSIKKPLKSVRNVIITGDTKLNFNFINKKIPNIECLKLTWIQTIDRKCVERKFPSLKELNVEIYDRLDGFTASNVQNAIINNPQLTRVCIKVHQRPDSDIDALQQFFVKHFNEPGKNALIISS